MEDDLRARTLAEIQTLESELEHLRTAPLRLPEAHQKIDDLLQAAYQKLDDRELLNALFDPRLDAKEVLDRFGARLALDRSELLSPPVLYADMNKLKDALRNAAERMARQIEPGPPAAERSERIARAEHRLQELRLIQKGLSA